VIHQLNHQKSHSEVSLDWLLEAYEYKPQVAVSNVPKEWSIADISDADFANVKVKPLTPAEKARKAKIKLEVQTIREMKK